MRRKGGMACLLLIQQLGKCLLSEGSVDYWKQKNSVHLAALLLKSLRRWWMHQIHSIVDSEIWWFNSDSIPSSQLSPPLRTATLPLFLSTFLLQHVAVLVHVASSFAGQGTPRSSPRPNDQLMAICITRSALWMHPMQSGLFVWLTNM